MRFLLASLTTLATVAIAAEVEQDVQEDGSQSPMTIKDRASAVSSVLKAMQSMKPSTTAPALATTTAIVDTTILTTTKKKPVKTTKKKPAKKTTKKKKKAAKTNKKAAVATPKIRIVQTGVDAPVTTEPANLQKRQQQTMQPWAGCGAGSPVTSTYDCVNGWACVSANAFYYQCLSATSSSAASRTTSATVTTTTAAAAAAVVTPTVDGWGACGVGSPVTQTYDCVNGWACVSANAYYYQCLSATSSSVRTSSRTASASSSRTTTVSTSATTTSATTSSVRSSATTSAPASSSTSSNSPSASSSAATSSIVTSSISSSGVSTITTLAAIATTSTAAVSTTTRVLGVNDPCGRQPNYGSTYIPGVMTPAGFLADNGLYIISGSARAPRGYTWEYAGFYASLNQDGYIGMLNLATYNVTECSAQCDSITGCKGFSIYYERSPTQNPASECPNPSMQTTIRCTFYNAAVDYQKATNIGEWRNQFAVVITGANGYSKL